jgi:hypothetical protein
MRAIILDSRNDVHGKCYLCRITLEDYVKNLPATYQDYDIQREIVTNVYLDHLVDTVLSQQHIPPIVLVVESVSFHEKEKILKIKTFKILDGLQRTFRLQAIRSTIDFCLSKMNDDENYLTWSKFKFSRKFSTPLRDLDSTTDILRSVLAVQKAKGNDALLDSFRLNNQWFEIWSDLPPEEEVRKMLTLNAGHKPVKTRHQLELLFLNLLPILREGEGSGFQLVREKDTSAAQFSKSRECGSFHFAHIITSLLSFYEGKPLAPSTGLIQTIQSSDIGIEEYSDLTSPEFLKDFVAFLVRLDRLLKEQHTQTGVLWMGREISLAGLCGALGAYALKHEYKRQAVMQRFTDIVRKNPGILRLNEFEAQRNNLDLSKVNIGNVNRAAVFSAVMALLESPSPSIVDWQKHFERRGDEKI